MLSLPLATKVSWISNREMYTTNKRPFPSFHNNLPYYLSGKNNKPEIIILPLLHNLLLCLYYKHVCANPSLEISERFCFWFLLWVS